MDVQDRRRSILRQIYRGPLNHFEIAARTGEAAFIVRAELKAMKRERLVRETLSPAAHLWHLTGRGYAELTGSTQGALL